MFDYHDEFNVRVRLSCFDNKYGVSHLGSAIESGVSLRM
ncbi:hypothetical protein V6Z11_D11G209700 [Gossypium hirsutum]